MKAINAKDFRRVLLFMSNYWNAATAVTIFGKVMGDHFYDKWASLPEHPHYSTMVLLLDMDDTYLQILLDYIKNYYNIHHKNL